MEKVKKVLKVLKLLDDQNEVNYTTLFGIIVVGKILMHPIDFTSALPLILAVGAHGYQESQR